MEPEKDQYEHARENAEAWLDDIYNMLGRLEHIANEGTCDPEDCDADIGGLDFDDYHNEESARMAIEESALSVRLRGGWRTPGWESVDEEFEILLADGEPSLRIIGEFGRDHSIARARLEMQDWSLPWQEYVGGGSHYAALRAYAESFWWGE